MPKPILNSRAAASPFRTQAGIPRIYVSAATGRVVRNGKEKARKAFTIRGTDRLDVLEEAVTLWIKTQGLGATLTIIHQTKRPRKAKIAPPAKQSELS